MSRLVVPMVVNALRVRRETATLAPPRFSELPYVGGDPRVDVNTGRPFLSEVTHDPAFTPPEYQLGTGVHLHWILPRFLRTTRTDGEALDFPPAPDQWVVVRRRAEAGAWVVERAWRVDAAYVWPEATPDDVPAGIVADPDEAFLRRGAVWPWKLGTEDDGTPRLRSEGGAPWRFVGATWPISTGPAWSTQAVPDDDPDATRLSATEVTAAGWGDPGHAGFYPGCVGQFGLFDDGTDESDQPVDLDAGSREYVVVGWYSASESNPLKAFLDGLDTQDPVERARRVARRLGLAVDAVPPDDLLLVGRVSSANFLTPASERPAPSFDVALAGSGTHALAAVLAREVNADPALATRPSVADAERQLDALLFARHLEGHSLDVGARLDELVSRREFRAHSGGVRAAVRGRPPPDAPTEGTAAPRPSSDIELPDELADVLDQLNAALAAGDVAEREIRHLRHHLYADWYRAILHTDPSASFALDWVQADEGGGATTADQIYGLARRRVAALDAALAARDAAAADRDRARLALEAAISTHNALDGAPQWSLDPVPAAPFYAPSEPAVALVPVGAAAHRQRWSGTALAHSAEGALLTATTSQLPDDAASVQAIVDAAAGLGLDPAVPTHEIAPLRMDWEVQLATASGQWPSSTPQFNPTLALTGTALLTDSATGVTKAAIRAYLRGRVTDDAALLAASLGAAWTPPDSLSDPEFDAWVDRLAPDLRTAARVLANNRELRDAAAAHREWATATPPPSFPATGALATLAWASYAATLPSDAPFPVPPAATWSDLVPGTGTNQEPRTAALRAAALLATVAGGAAGAADGFLLGVPRGGWLDREVTHLANTLDEDALRQLADDAAVVAICDARECPFENLADLARLPEVNARVIGGLVARVEAAPLPTQRETPSLGDARVDPFATALAAWIELQSRGEALVHTLDGLNDALLQWDAAPQLPMEDPLGFQDHRDFLDQVLRPAVYRSRRRAPRHDFPFAPLRAGWFALTRLRLVDSFGGAQDIALGTVATPTSWSSGSPDLPVGMPLRLVQPSRLAASWVDGGDPDRPWSPHPGRSPVCGWFVLDSFASQLDVHDGDGAPVGSLDEDGTWRPSPGRRGPSHLGAVQPPVLARLAERITAEFGVQAFADGVDRALQDIHPTAGEDDQAISLLLSRPLAVVQLDLRWEAAEPLAVRLDAAGLAAEIAGQPDDAGVGAHGMAVQVGAGRRLHDGVVAWCEVTPAGLGPIQLPHRGATFTTVTLDGARAPRIVLVVDPSAEVHLLADLLPPLVLRLPGVVLAEAARSHELLSYSGPHLTPRDALRAPTLQEAGWTPTMVLPEPGQWVELTDRPLVDRAVLERKLDQPLGVWDRLVADGILVPLDAAPQLARLAPLPPATAGAEPVSLEAHLSGYPAPAQLVTALATTGRIYGPPLHDLAFSPLELREAFLHLRRTTPGAQT